MLYLLIVILLVCILCIFATVGRRGHTKLARLSCWEYAHRGLHGECVPENSLKAFRRAITEGFGVELDIRLLADGNLAVIHDSSLKRTAGIDLCVEDLTLEELSNYYLEGTFETVPELSQVLDILAGEVPVIVELKTKADNVEDICRAACRVLDDYAGQYCVESFDPRCVRWFRNNRPNVVRGQLAENYFKEKDCKLNFAMKFVMTNHLANFWTYPDFIAYRFSDRNNLMTKVCRKIWKIQGFTWTVKNKRDFDKAANEGWVPIFERTGA